MFSASESYSGLPLLKGSIPYGWMAEDSIVTTLGPKLWLDVYDHLWFDLSGGKEYVRTWIRFIGRSPQVCCLITCTSIGMNRGWLGVLPMSQLLRSNFPEDLDPELKGHMGHCQGTHGVSAE